VARQRQIACPDGAQASAQPSHLEPLRQISPWSAAFEHSGTLAAAAQWLVSARLPQRQHPMISARALERTAYANYYREQLLDRLDLMALAA